MSATVVAQPVDFEAEVREFAAQFPTEAVLRALAVCESGRLPWESVHTLCRVALAKGLKEVQA